MKLYLLDLLFSDESTFYLDSSVGVWWVKSNLKNYINAKKKEKKLRSGLQLSKEENHHWIEWKNMNTKNYLKVLEKVIEREERTQRYFMRCLISSNWKCKILLVNWSTWILL